MRKFVFSALLVAVFLAVFSSFVVAQEYWVNTQLVPSPVRVIQSRIIPAPTPSTVYVIRNPVVTVQRIAPPPPVTTTVRVLPTERISATSTQSVLSGPSIVRTAVTTEYYGIGNVVIPQGVQVSRAHCVVYGDDSMTVSLYLPNNTVQQYFLSNPSLRTRESQALYRTTYLTVEQKSPAIIFGPLSSDVYSNGNDIYQIFIYGRNNSSVRINLSRR